MNKFNFTEDTGHLKEFEKGILDMPFKEMYSSLVKENIRLLKFLYDKHRNILREYEKNILKSKLRIEFA